jgi:alanine racemase
MSRHAIAVLSLGNLIHNFQVIKSHVGSSKIIVMVKANAYGHGIRSVAKRLDSYVDMFGVASIDEALILRKIGIKSPILLAEGIFEESELIIAAAENFHIVFHNIKQIEWLERSILPIPIHAWLKLNTGMGRLGINLDIAEDIYHKIKNNSQVASCKIMSHFACSDDKNHPLNQQQINALNNFVKNKNDEISFCNSAAIFHFPQCHHDYVRPGIAIYGISPIDGVSATELNLKPVITLQTRLISVQIMPKGSSIGYGARYICDKDMPVGIIAFGYGDGYPISANDQTPILVNNIKCNIIGRVSMDMIAIDLSNQPNADIGDPVILWGNGLAVEEVVKYTSEITWSLVTGIQNRVKFIWTKS